MLLIKPICPDTQKQFLQFLFIPSARFHAGSAGNLCDFEVPQIMRREKIMKLSKPLKLAFLFEVNSTHSLTLLLF